jgi:hypothetical protein
MSIDDLRQETYLGDGVYARFDGYHVWLRTPREIGDHEIALEPGVVARLATFIADLRVQFPGETVPAWEYLKAAVKRATGEADIPSENET